MIDPQQEQLLSLAEVARTLPKIDGKRQHPSTIWRWCRKGIGGVRLEYVRLGRRVCTSREALTRFMHARAEADGIPPEPAPRTAPVNRARTSQQRQAAIDAAGKRLAAAGVKDAI